MVDWRKLRATFIGFGVLSLGACLTGCATLDRLGARLFVPKAPTARIHVVEIDDTTLAEIAAILMQGAEEIDNDSDGEGGGESD